MFKPSTTFSLQACAIFVCHTKEMLRNGYLIQFIKNIVEILGKLVSLNCFEELPTLKSFLHSLVGTAVCSAITRPRRSVHTLVSPSIHA